MLWQSVCSIIAICTPRIRNPFAAKWQVVSSCRGPIYRARIYVFATHSQSVQNTFTECSQRVRYLCVTYSPCKSMVFALQKYGFWRAKRGFYIAKVWFLFFECWVVAICLECFGNPSATFWQSVSSRRGPIYRVRIYIFTTHFVCVWLILKACYGSFAL